MINNSLDTTIGSLALDNNGIDPAASVEKDQARETAKKFEALLLQTMLKNMRAATPGDSLFNNEQTGLYFDMFDQQIAKDISQSKTFGLAETIYQQLVGNAGTSQSAARGSTLPLQSQVVGVGGARMDNHYQSSQPTPAGFVSRIQTAAKQTAHELGTSTAAVVAVAALETGWGKSVATQSDGRSTNNLFGIKADSQWSGGTSLVRTHEYTAGESQAQNAVFRVYQSEQQSIRDFGHFLKSNPRYQSALQSAGDPQQFVRELQRAGYATDPNYADKVISIMNSINDM